MQHWQQPELRQQVPIIPVADLPAKTSEIAARVNGHPSQQLTVIGITGTNGKTSCSQFIAHCLSQLGYRCGVLGTLGYGEYQTGLADTDQHAASAASGSSANSGDHDTASDRSLSARHRNSTQPGEPAAPGKPAAAASVVNGTSQLSPHLTTPDAVTTQALLANMVQAQLEPVVMEVSSIGLQQGRVSAVQFDTALFTNLSRDHLDYHQSMEDYAANKLKLFTSSQLRHAIINLDDPWAETVKAGTGSHRQSQQLQPPQPGSLSLCH